ncbi:MAG: hypothetical protein ABSB50_13475, partial [Terracidiphilus sp.]
MAKLDPLEPGSPAIAGKSEDKMFGAVLDNERRTRVSRMAKVHKSRLLWSQQQRLMEHFVAGTTA